MKFLIFLIVLLYSITVFSEEINIKCKETTGTGRHDIFKINDPKFFWYYDKKWYELAVSKTSTAKDWEVSFKKEKIRLFNTRMKWLREINLKEMTAFMKFPTGEFYLYKCKKL
jgi:hypothetical protein